MLKVGIHSHTVQEREAWHWANKDENKHTLLRLKTQILAELLTRSHTHIKPARGHRERDDGTQSYEFVRFNIILGPGSTK